MTENIGIVPASGILDRYRFAVWDCYSESSSTYNQKLHFHDFFEMSLVYQGKCIYLVNGSQFNMTKGSIQLVTPSDYHMQILNEGESFRYYNLIFSEDILDEQLSELICSLTKPLCITPPVSERDRIFTIVRNLLSEYRRLEQGHPEIGCELLIQKGIEEICIYLLRLLQTNPNDDSDQLKPIRQALSYIRQNYRSRLSLSEVAEAVHLSPAYLSLLFSKTMRVRFSDYLTDYRLNMAARYLRSGDLPLKEIASVCGFTTFSYFSAAFKSRFGVSPSIYRKKGLSNIENDSI